MTIQTTYNSISRSAWAEVVRKSPTGNWFQSPEVYEFFCSLSEQFRPFVVALSNESGLRGVCVGYITVEHNPLKQFATRRAIIVGGPALAEDCTNEEVETLMRQVRAKIEEQGGAIYIETRNFNDYSRWREGFERAGFVYEEHNNFHIATESFAVANENEDERTKCYENENQDKNIEYAKVVNGLMGKNRVRDIKTSFRDGAVVIDHPTIEQVREYYAILKNLYTTKVKTPLFPLSFFEKLYEQKDGRFILVGLKRNENDNENQNEDIEIIGGTVCVAQEGRCLYEWFVAGRDGEWKSIFPSSVATYAGIRYAAENGMPRFDMMGAGTPKETYGVRDFKARFGGELVEHGRYKCICKPLLYKCGELGVKLLKHRK